MMEASMWDSSTVIMDTSGQTITAFLSLVSVAGSDGECCQTIRLNVGRTRVSSCPCPH